jgi:hypothetical protein
MKAPNEKPTVVLTQAQMVRLECLRLVYHPTKDAPFLITRAVEFESYVNDGKAEPLGISMKVEIATDRQDAPDVPV